MSNRKYIFGIILISIILSCTEKKDNGNILARVQNEYLYESDIQDIIPVNSSSNDSLNIVKSYINNWIRQKILLKKAESNLMDDQKDFSKQLDEYKNSLIIYTYESILIQQSLDTIISPKEIEEYYNKHKEGFQLKSNILKVMYVKVKEDSQYAYDFKQLLLDYEKNQQQSTGDSLLRMCELYADDYNLNNEQWIYFDNLLKRIPITTYNQEAYLKNNKFIELIDNSYAYYGIILDFSMKDEYSPLDFERNNIRRLILNSRKSELLRKMREDTFNQALENNDIEIF